METILPIKPLISIVICTYNNADSLKLTIQQLLNQSVNEPAQFEIIVIDNKSTDHTSAVIHSFHSDRFSYQTLFESRQGLSHARNTGINAAQGDYILFTDDDAELPNNWLSNYLEEIQSSNADCIFGKISVIWDQQKPWWYDDRYRGFFAVIDYGNENFQVLTKSKPFFGKNFCIKKSFLIEMGGFDPKLGRNGEELLGGEEILVFNRLIDTRKKVIYSTNITVGHRLKPREYTEENIKKQYLACSKAIFQIAKTQPGMRLGTRPLGVLELQIKEAIAAFFLMVKFRLQGNSIETFFNTLRLSRAIKTIKLWIKN